MIYLNGNAKYDLTKAFTTIAHEGYPGHLISKLFLPVAESFAGAERREHRRLHRRMGDLCGIVQLFSGRFDEKCGKFF